MYSPSISWDLGAVLFLLGIVVPWRGAVRVRELLVRPSLNSADRIAIYASTIAFQWLLAGFTAWRCIARGWSLGSLGFALPDPITGTAVGVVLASLLTLTQLASFRQLARIPPEHRGRLYEIARKLMPQNLAEALPFVALVCTVSLCEEFLYRGFVFSAFEREFHNSAAAAILGSSALFAVAHLYQGRRGLINTFFLGAIFAGVRLWTGSLAPSVMAHLAVDLVAGWSASRWAVNTGRKDAAAGAGGQTGLSDQ